LRVGAHQVEDTGGALLLVSVLDEEQETLASLAGPSSSGVGDLRLLAAKVLSEAGSRNGLLAEPEVLLNKTESAAPWLVFDPDTCCATCYLLLQARGLVAQSTAVDGLDDLLLDLLVLLLLLNWGSDGSLALGIRNLLGLGCLSGRDNGLLASDLLDGNGSELDRRRGSLGGSKGCGCCGRHLVYIERVGSVGRVCVRRAWEKR
jgi:hypothetical protein